MGHSFTNYAHCNNGTIIYKVGSPKTKKGNNYRTDEFQDITNTKSYL